MRKWLLLLLLAVPLLLFGGYRIVFPDFNAKLQSITERAHRAEVRFHHPCKGHGSCIRSVKLRSETEIEELLGMIELVPQTRWTMWDTTDLGYQVTLYAGDEALASMECLCYGIRCYELSPSQIMLTRESASQLTEYLDSLAVPECSASNTSVQTESETPIR